MNNEIKTIKIDNFEFDSQTGELVSDSTDLKCFPAFSGIKNGKVYINNKLTVIDAKKFQALPISIQNRILLYPHSDYTRDILSQPFGSIAEDTFPNFNGISYMPDGKAIILNNEEGTPIRKPLFMD